jgi:hypothetical protein
VTGAVTRNTIGQAAPAVQENLVTATDGTITGTVAATSSRSFVLEGFVRTSHGEVRTTVEQTLDFSNNQSFVVPQIAANYVQNITQKTNIVSKTRVSADGRESTVTTRMSWPLEVDITAPPDGSFQTTVSQSYEREDAIAHGDDIVYSSTVSNHVAPHDNYPSGQGQANSQQYFSTDSTGACYSRSITAAAGVLTQIVDGALCRDR